ncbi:MAG: hypothetical protein P4M13_03165 [Alphaproteobacteria bacterium]|nr:hypothetical protein [Alphaproteobacteria bacterium]
MSTYVPTMKDDFEELAQQLLQQRTTMLEDEILSFWRSYEPEKLKEFFLHGMARRALKQRAADILAVQKTMEEMEQLPSSLARMEAWRNLMRIEEEEDEADKEADWGPWREEYRNLMEELR